VQAVLAAVQRGWGHLGVQVVGAAAGTQDKAAAVRKFARRHEISFPLVLEATTEHMESFGLPPALPGTVVLRRDGSVAARFPGVIERSEVEHVLRDLLDENPDAEEQAEAIEPPAGEKATEASRVPS
jgi:peroxiredoxin